MSITDQDVIREKMKYTSSILTIVLLTFLLTASIATTISASDKNAWWFNKGNDLFHQKKYDESLKHFNKAIEIDPNDFFALHMKGNCLTMLKRYDEALIAIDKSLEINKYNPATSFSKGAVLVQMKKYTEAIAVIDFGILVLNELRKDKDFAFLDDKAVGLANTYNLRGQSLLALKKFKESIESFDKGLSIEPKNYLLWCGKGIALDQIGKKETAAEAFSKAQQYSDNVDVCSSLILLY